MTDRGPADLPLPQWLLSDKAKAAAELQARAEQLRADKFRADKFRADRTQAEQGREDERRAEQARADEELHNKAFEDRERADQAWAEQEQSEQEQAEQRPVTHPYAGDTRPTPTRENQTPHDHAPRTNEVYARLLAAYKERQTIKNRLPDAELRAPLGSSRAPSTHLGAGAAAEVETHSATDGVTDGVTEVSDLRLDEAPSQPRYKNTVAADRSPGVKATLDLSEVDIPEAPPLVLKPGAANQAGNEQQISGTSATAMAVPRHASSHASQDRVLGAEATTGRADHNDVSNALDDFVQNQIRIEAEKQTKRDPRSRGIGLGQAAPQSVQAPERVPERVSSSVPSPVSEASSEPSSEPSSESSSESLRGRGHAGPVSVIAQPGVHTGMAPATAPSHHPMADVSMPHTKSFMARLWAGIKATISAFMLFIFLLLCSLVAGFLFGYLGIANSL